MKDKVKVDFRRFDNSYHDRVCDFLIELSKDKRKCAEPLMILSPYIISKCVSSHQACS
jgi:hypothetical protein